jgi:gliding motility-associated-like protein
MYINCPTSLIQLDSCADWSMPTAATPDYYNACSSSSGLVNVPYAAFGYQDAYSGNAYAGLAAITTYSGPPTCSYAGNWWFEYIQGHLRHPLVAGHKHIFSMRVSLSENSTAGVSRLGCFFSAGPVTSCNSLPLNYVPQVESPAGQYFTDQSGWTLVSGTFTAGGGEDYLTIGNFRDSLSTDTVQVVPGSIPLSSYYYVDDVQVEDLDAIDCNVFTPNGDGINDEVDFSFLNLVETRITIYDRWGLEVFHTDQYHTSWDGTTRHGKECPDGVYFYCLASTGVVNKTYDLKGFIQLLR